MPSRSLFLSVLQPGAAERRLALMVALACGAAFFVLAPFARTPLAPVAAFLPAYESALVVCDLVTAVLLLGQYGIVRNRALLVLATGYIFSAMMAVAHALSFPGLFAPGGLLGAGPQTTAWIYFLWHGGFPLFVIAYASLKNEAAPSPQMRESASHGFATSSVSALAIAALLTFFAVHAPATLPPLMAGDTDAPMKVAVATATWLASVLALAVLWRRKPHSVLDLWLMVVLVVWTADTALSAVLNHARFDVGWYFGRVYGLAAGSFVLAVLLLENGMLYARLAHAREAERRRARQLQELSTQLRSANDLLGEKNLQLQEASRLKSEFLANMSHELRTPLNAVIGFSEVLKDGLIGELSPEQREYITDIYNGGQHLLSLINDILDLSKIEAGQMTLDLEPTAASALFEHSLSIVKERAARRRLTLALDVPTGLGSLQVDPRKTKQIVYNLLSNAVKFTREGGEVTLRARRVSREAMRAWTAATPTLLRMAEPSVDCDEYLQIEVEDTGIGIAPDDASKLFRMFSQLDSSLGKEAEGTGLGLALVERLARLHGGTVALASTPGSGSDFIAWLPWREAGTITACAPVAGGAARAADGLEEPDRPIALVIEDNERAGELIRVQLEPEGFEVVRAGTARLALDLLAALRPAVVILDLILPDMDGWDLLARLKQPGSRSAHIPVVIVSIVADAQKGIALGAGAVLQKPVSRDDLLAAFEEVGVLSGERQTKVLVVDDDPKAVELLATYLDRPRWTVLRAHGGREAIECAVRERPDLIVLDLTMPEVSGFDVVEDLRNRAETAATPIIVLTSRTLDADDRATLNGLVAVVLHKADFDQGQFLAEVRRAVSRQRIPA
ncbi:MAG TPA: response regulator [Ramlibacter sp.]|uniref:response regulator n=1 Tax=Ramlibacter sp. TaxID=1917967 RepID=UPI002BDEFE15|nr:response regulator [Ramlibacter sp.]HVZ44075.1 response regulator [Ramlibacter sp.]